MCEKEMVQKRVFYEWACRVPLIVRFPDGWKAGTTCTTPASLVDLLPTFCELAGAEDLLPHDGDSLLPLIEGEREDRVVFAQAHEAVGVPCIMARQGRYKYVYHTPADDKHPAERELYDMKADPQEFHNLAGDPAHKDRITRMHALLLGELGEDPDVTEQRCRADLAKGYGRELKKKR